MWNRELEIAKEAAAIAGQRIMEIYDSGVFGVEYKEDQSPLTLADKASNDIIVEMLRHEFPKYSILSEEEKDNKDRLENDCCFVVDPLDGTKEFVKRNGQFTVNIALSYKHESVMGVIYVPATQELYYASRGDGAFYVPGDGGAMKHLKVSKNTDTASMKVVMSSSHGCEQMEEIIKRFNFTDLVRIGSSLKGCMVARGLADIYYRHNPTMEWDTAAMQCIVEEAGGVFRQMDDTPMRYNREDSLNSKGFYCVNCEKNIPSKIG